MRPWELRLLAFVCVGLLAGTLTTVAQQASENAAGSLLHSEIVAKRQDDKAVGAFRITNQGKVNVTVSKLLYGFRFSETVQFDGYKGSVHKDDIRQLNSSNSCGQVQLPIPLQPGATLECPFTSRENIYKGDIDITAALVDADAPDYFTGQYLTFSYLILKDPQTEDGSEATGDKIATKDHHASAAIDDDEAAGDSEATTAATSSAASPQRAYKGRADASITGNDIECAYQDQTGPQKFCKVCGGQAEVEARCNSIKDCVAYDMESDECGYLKSGTTPQRTGHKGFTSYVLTP